MTRIPNALLALAIFPGAATAQAAPRGPLEGAWRVVEIVVTGANPSTTMVPQPGLFIFTRTHYSAMWVPGGQARMLFQAEDPTNDEKIAAFDTFVANIGTYDTSGSTLTTRPMVARYPNCMGGALMRFQFRVDGDTLWLAQKSSDVHCLIGQRPVPYSGPATETRWRLTRVE